jgi:hypothetical protein
MNVSHVLVMGVEGNCFNALEQDELLYLWVSGVFLVGRFHFLYGLRALTNGAMRGGGDVHAGPRRRGFDLARSSCPVVGRLTPASSGLPTAKSGLSFAFLKHETHLATPRPHLRRRSASTPGAVLGTTFPEIAAIRHDQQKAIFSIQKSARRLLAGGLHCHLHQHICYSTLPFT